MPSIRKITLRRAGWGLIALLAGCVGWQLATQETATAVLRFDSYNATFGWLGTPQEATDWRPEFDDARFWIDLVDQDLAGDRSSVDRQLEGAWLLRLLAERSNPPSAIDSSLLREAAGRRFRQLCETAPHDPRVWRSLISGVTEQEDLVDLFPDWSGDRLELFWKMIPHDPGNAFYDYLAILWSSELTFSNEEEIPSAEPIDRPSRSTHERMIELFRERAARLGEQPFFADAGDVSVFARRCLARLPLSSLERTAIVGELWLNLMRGEYRLPSDFHFFFELQTEPCNLSLLRRQFLAAEPPSPLIDHELKQLEWDSDLEFGVDSQNANDTAPADPAQSAAAINGLQTRISQSALESIDARYGFTQLHVPWVTTLTRNRLLLCTACLITVGGIGTVLLQQFGHRQAARNCSAPGWGISVVAAIAGQSLAALILLLSIVQETSAGIEIFHECLQFTPIVVFGVLMLWMSRRLLRTRFAANRTARIGMIILALALFGGWNVLYRGVLARSGFDVSQQVVNLGQSVFRRLHIDSATAEYWDRDALSRLLNWPWNSSDNATSTDWPQLVVSQGLPLGLALATLIMLPLAGFFPRAANGQSIWNRLCRATPRSIDAANDLPSGSWGAQYAATISHGWLRLGLWSLSLWVAATASAMQTADVQYQRAFGTLATQEQLWQDYQQALSQINGDGELVERLMHPQFESSGFICF